MHARRGGHLPVQRGRRPGSAEPEELVHQHVAMVREVVVALNVPPQARVEEDEAGGVRPDQALYRPIVEYPSEIQYRHDFLGAGARSAEGLLAPSSLAPGLVRKRRILPTFRGSARGYVQKLWVVEQYGRVASEDHPISYPHLAVVEISVLDRVIYIVAEAIAYFVAAHSFVCHLIKLIPVIVFMLVLIWQVAASTPNSVHKKVYQVKILISGQRITHHLNSFWGSFGKTFPRKMYVDSTKVTACNCQNGTVAVIPCD